MNNCNIQESSDLALKAIAEAYRVAKDLSIAAIESILNQAFEAHPELEAIMWKQYLPTWNDGDECTFHMGDIWGTSIKDQDAYLERLNEEDSNEEDFFISEYSKSVIGQGVLKPISHLLGQVDTREIYGSNALVVIVTREGTEVLGYDCGY